MITFLASPKNFTGKIAEIQRRAIQSWLLIDGSAEVILYGESEGADIISRQEARVKHIPSIASSSTGVPRFDAIAQHATEHGRHDLQVYVNCDILLPPDMLRKLKVINLARFLVVGQRIDLADGVEFDPTTADWAEAARGYAISEQAVTHAVSGMDYFVFRRGSWTGLSPLVVGRGGYDAALIAFCLKNSIPIVDATWEVLALHQFHDYGHMSTGIDGVHQGDDAKMNYALHNTRRSTPSVADADYLLFDGRISAWKCRGDKVRTFELYLRYRLGHKSLSLLARAFWRLAVAFGLIRRKPVMLLDILLHVRPNSIPGDAHN